MITILHGENVLASRNILESIKNQHKGNEIITLDGRKINLTGVKQALEAGSMFASGRLVIIENLFLGKGKNQQEILDYIAENSAAPDLIIWEEKEVPRNLLIKVPKAKVLFLKSPPILFKFLESIKPNNQYEMLNLIEQCLKVESPEMIFYMLVRQVRLLTLIKDGITSGTPELNRLAPWQKEKFSRQAKYFSLEALIDIYHKLLEIEYREKSGQSPLDLSKTLELFLTNL